MSSDLPAVPFLTPDRPGTGGRIKVEPPDFEVEELSAYEPSGAGDHLFLWVEKTDLGAEFFVRQVARRPGIPNGEVGTAGLKDRRAVTRQMVSVPARAEPRLSELAGDGIRLLQVSRHGNKLRPGHLRGNRFRILVRGAEATADRASLRRNGLRTLAGSPRSIAIPSVAVSPPRPNRWGP